MYAELGNFSLWIDDSICEKSESYIPVLNNEVGTSVIGYHFFKQIYLSDLDISS